MSTHPHPALWLPAAGLLTLSVLFTACGRAPDAAAGSAASAPASASAAGPAASAPPVGVTTVRAQQRDLPVLIGTTGIVAPLSSVEVRPQTTSLVAQVHVKEGQFVKAGQLLFTLDARAADADVAKARAQLARDEAALADAQRQLRRSQELLAQNFISQGALDTNQTNVQSLSAALAADKAALDAVRLGLSYTRITAPGAGRLGAINVFPGSSVQANQTTLVSITQLDPIAVSFSLPQRHLADALAALKDGGAVVTATPPDTAAAPVVRAPREGGRARAAGADDAQGSTPVPAVAGGQDVRKDGSNAPSTKGEPGGRQDGGTNTTAAKDANVLSGRLSFVDNSVDAASGSVKVKAQFDNREGKLWPGAFVNVALTARVITGAVIVPQAAIIQSARGTLVYAVQDGKAVARPVQVLHAQGEDAAVSGVKPGERIVLDGRQNVRPGAAVVERSADGGGGRGGRGGAASAAASGAPSAVASAAGRGATP